MAEINRWRTTLGGRHSRVFIAAIVTIGISMQFVSPGGTSAETASQSASPQGELPQPLQALFIGDSYTFGAGLSDKTTRWSALVSSTLAWQETNRALGGTGYVTSSGVNGCGVEYCNALAEQTEALTSASPDIVVFSGGRNDGEPSKEYATSVTETLAAAVEQRPEAEIVVISPIWDDVSPPTWFDNEVDAVRTASANAGATFLDIGEPCRAALITSKTTAFTPLLEGTRR